jgi:hypothetical protein
LNGERGEETNRTGKNLRGKTFGTARERDDGKEKCSAARRNGRGVCDDLLPTEVSRRRDAPEEAARGSDELPIYFAKLWLCIEGEYCEYFHC